MINTLSTVIQLGMITYDDVCIYYLATDGTLTDTVNLKIFPFPAVYHSNVRSISCQSFLPPVSLSLDVPASVPRVGVRASGDHLYTRRGDVSCHRSTGHFNPPNISHMDFSFWLFWHYTSLIDAYMVANRVDWIRIQSDLTLIKNWDPFCSIQHLYRISIKSNWD